MHPDNIETRGYMYVKQTWLKWHHFTMKNSMIYIYKGYSKTIPGRSFIGPYESFPEVLFRRWHRNDVPTAKSGVRRPLTKCRNVTELHENFHMGPTKRLWRHVKKWRDKDDPCQVGWSYVDRPSQISKILLICEILIKTIKYIE